MMFHTYDKATITLSINGGPRIDVTRASFEFTPGPAASNLPLRSTHFQAEATMAMSSEQWRRFEAAIRRMEMKEARRRGWASVAWEKARREMETRAVSLAHAIEKRTPPYWTPGRNPGIPLPRFPRMRCAAMRQSVPPRTRRRRRTWER